jgi:hypothetical protein
MVAEHVAAEPAARLLIAVVVQFDKVALAAQLPVLEGIIGIAGPTRW